MIAPGYNRVNWCKTLLLLLTAAAGFFPAPARAQLAITEMMSAALKTNGLIVLTNNSDFWELTNFGTNRIDVYGYWFSDGSGSLRSLPSVTLEPLESVVFVRNNITLNETQFREWWGSCVGTNVQVRFYRRPGFSGSGDGIRIYDPYGYLLDSVDFGPATRGVSFGYDPETGVFGRLSDLSDPIVCQAATAPDIASPGRNTGPIPLRIVEHPRSIAACLGDTATFRVHAVGMPRPRYQWYFGDTPLFGETYETLTIYGASLEHRGTYRVVVSNGLSMVQSLDATLTIDTNLSAPVFVTPPRDATVVTNRTARFSVAACAFPAPTYQWFSNGVPMQWATGPTLLVPNCTFAMSNTEYCVRVQNSLGSTTACARLYVTAKPDLRITEVQAYPVTGCNAHHDWFEVTNYGSNAVDMIGYRFSDEFSLDGSVTVTQHLVVASGESVIFHKFPLASTFIEWWGADLLPPNVKIFPYSGFSLFKGGDTLYLWNAEAQLAEESIDGIQFATNFHGVSQRFDFETAPFGEDSVPGMYGAFRAQSCGDIGSPGFVANPPARFVRIVPEPGGMQLIWRAVEGATYRVECRENAGHGGWTLLDNVTATDALVVWRDREATNSSVRQRFYHVRQIGP